MGRLMAAVVLLAAACGSPGATTTTASTASTTTVATAASTASTTTSSTTSTPAPTTTVPATTVATTAPPGIAYEVAEPTLFPWEPLEGSGGASGSGCSPGAGTLPDGVWFGYVPAREGDRIEFDLACWYFGDLAWEKAAEEGEEANNDYWVVNQNPTLRTVAVPPTVTVYEIDSDCCAFLAVPFAEWPANPDGYIQCPTDWCGVWLLVNGGAVTEIVEQYVP